MEFKDIIQQRYAVRQFEDRKVPEDLIQELLEMIVLTPSALNLQPWKIKVVSDQKTKDELYEGTWEQAHVKTCSHLLVLCADVDITAEHRQVGQDGTARSGCPTICART